MKMTQEIEVTLRLRGISHTCENCRRWKNGVCSVGDFFRGTRVRARTDSCKAFYPRVFLPEAQRKSGEHD